MGLTQGLLAALVARHAPRDLRGSAFGMFNLASGVALLVASVVAGLLWDAWGPRFTFLAGPLHRGGVGGTCAAAAPLSRRRLTRAASGASSLIPASQDQPALSPPSRCAALA